MVQVALNPTNARYPVDLPEIFWDGLLQEIQTHAASLHYTLLTPRHHYDEPNDKATYCLRYVKNTAIRFKVQLSNLTIYNLQEMQSQILNIRSTAKETLRRTFTQFKEEIQASKD